MPKTQQFPPAQPIIRIPTSIGSLKIEFVRGYGQATPDLKGDPNKLMEAALYDDLIVRDQDEDVMKWQNGDLVPFLTPQEITGLRNLMDRLWALAEMEVLP